MSYIFRIHNQESSSNMQGTGWTINGAGNGTPIPVELIEDGDHNVLNGKEGTSIPTPFARIYLFKTACESIRVEREKNSRGEKGKINPIYKRLYCHCLDLLQFLFEHGKETMLQTSKFSIECVNLVAGQKQERFNREYPFLADAINQAMLSSEKSTGRRYFESPIYIISYDGILLGGTSPFTFVYTSPNLEREIEEHRKKNNWLNPFYSNKKARFFSNDEKDLKFLEDRPKEFQQYVHNLLERCNLPGVDNRQEILRCFEFSPEFHVCDLDLRDLRSSDSSGNLATPNGVALSYNNSKADMSGSAFLMKPNREVFNDRCVPLALPSKAFSSAWIYIDEPWDSSTQITDGQCEESPKIQSRSLPKPGSTGESSTIDYPWVSEPDFFENVLIDLGYPLNSGGEGRYFAPSFPIDRQNLQFRFLIPIKSTYFKYFTVEDLKRSLTVSAVDATDSKFPIFNRVEFSLSIPLENGKNIIFRREYTKAGLRNSVGNIIEGDYKIKPLENAFALSVFPFHRIINRDDKKLRNAYSVHLFSQYPKVSVETQDPSDLRLKFLNKSGESANMAMFRSQNGVERSNTKRGEWSKIYTIKPLTKDANGETEFDSIRVLAGSEENPEISGLFIPNFKKRLVGENPNQRACFAIDFGTSNTHIAYLDGEVIKPFTITEPEMQAVSTAKPFEFNNREQYRSDAKHLQDVYDSIEHYSECLREFAPALIGHNPTLAKGVEYPVKTATLETPTTMAMANPVLFASANIGFDIDTEEIAVDSNQWEYKTNIKWELRRAGSDYPRKRVTMYCEQTLWMIKNSIIEKGLYPENISIVYFYPESMSQMEQSALKEIWENAKVAVFDNCNFISCTIDSILESVAPYYSLVTKYRDLFNYNYLNIDIGGGTTDYFIIEKERIGCDESGYEASVLFAGNNIWGESDVRDDFQTDTPNGFIDSMESMIAHLNGISPEAQNAYKCFSGKLIEDRELKGHYRKGLKNQDMAGFLFAHDDEYHFSQMLRSEDARYLRFVLYLHFAAIVYYASQMFTVIKTDHSDFKIPRVVSFTGKGSEYIKLLGNADLITELTKYLLLLFDSTLDPAIISNLSVKFPESPKIVTAEGGVRKNNLARSEDTVWVSGTTTTVESKDEEDERFRKLANAKKIGVERYYQNMTKSTRCFELAGCDSMDARSQNVKDAVMLSLDTFINQATDRHLANIFTNLDIKIPDDFKDKFKKYAENSYALCAQLYKDKKVSEIDDNLFFFALRTSLIELSSDCNIS